VRPAVRAAFLVAEEDSGAGRARAWLLNQPWPTTPTARDRTTAPSALRRRRARIRLSRSGPFACCG